MTRIVGKTQRLVSQALDCARSGKKVYFVVHQISMLEYIMGLVRVTDDMDQWSRRDRSLFHKESHGEFRVVSSQAIDDFLYMGRDPDSVEVIWDHYRG